MSHFVTVWQLLVCLAVVLALYFHRIILLILSAPMIRWTQYVIRKRQTGNLQQGDIVFRIANKFSYMFDRLFLYWIGNIHSHRIRMFFYKYVYLMDIAGEVTMYYNIEIRNPSGIKIGKGTIIGENAILDGRAGLEIGNNVNFSSNVRIWTLQHDYRDPDFACNPEHYGPVKICDRAWIGPHTIILHDVTVGEGAVIAAGAVVTKDVLPYTLVGWGPAKQIGIRPRGLRYEFHGGHPKFL